MIYAHPAVAVSFKQTQGALRFYHSLISRFSNRTPDFPEPIVVEGRGAEDIKCPMAIFEVTNLVKPWPSAIYDSPFAMKVFVKVPFIALPSAGLLELQLSFGCTNFLLTLGTESPPVSPSFPYTPLSSLNSRRSLLSYGQLCLTSNPLQLPAPVLLGDGPEKVTSIQSPQYLQKQIPKRLY